MLVVGSLVRILVFCLAWVCVLAPAATEVCAQELLTRKWESGNFKVDGKLLSYSDTHVTLRTVKRDSVAVAIDELSEPDKIFLKGLRILDAGEQQLDTIAPHLENVEKDPITGLEILEEVDRVQEGSPYAALYAGLLQSTEAGDFRKSRRHFERSIRLISEHRETFGESYMAETMRSLRNNVAVCQLHVGNGDKAAEAFKLGADGELPFVIYHNAWLLMAIEQGSRTGIRLAKRTRKKLVGLVAVRPPDPPSVQIPERFILSANCDLPLTPKSWSALVETMHREGPAVGAKAKSIARDREFGGRKKQLSLENLREENLFPVLWCARCDHDGKLPCPNRCGNGVFVERKRYQAGTFPVSGDPIWRWSTSVAFDFLHHFNSIFVGHVDVANNAVEAA